MRWRSSSSSGAGETIEPANQGISETTKQRIHEAAGLTDQAAGRVVHLGFILAVLTAATAICAQAPPGVGEPSACDQVARKVLSDIRISYVAKEGEIYLQSARRAFGESPPGCTSGLWYLAAARLLRESGETSPLSAGGTALKSAREALEKGLASDPSQPQLLAFVAYLSAASPSSSPPLPENACASFSDAVSAPLNLKAYVCGHAALRRKDYASAEKLLADVEKSSSFPDAALRRAEALLALGRKKEARASAKLALDLLQPGSPLLLASGATEKEIRVLREKASTIANAR